MATNAIFPPAYTGGPNLRPRIAHRQTCIDTEIQHEPIFMVHKLNLFIAALHAVNPNERFEKIMRNHSLHRMVDAMQKQPESPALLAEFLPIVLGSLALAPHTYHPRQRIAALESRGSNGKMLFATILDLNNPALTFEVCSLIGQSHFKTLAKSGGDGIMNLAAEQLRAHHHQTLSAEQRLEAALSTREIRSRSMVLPPASRTLRLMTPPSMGPQLVN